MKKNLFLIAFAMVIASCQQQQRKDESSLEKTLKSVTGKIDNLSTDSVRNTSFIAANGEKFLRQEIIVNDSLEDVWKNFTTEQGLKTWMSPVVQLDFRIGGMMQTNYDKNAKIGDKGTIPHVLINYLPNEFLLYKIKLSEAFSEKCRKEDENLQELIQFQSTGNNSVKITTTMMGWGKGKEWEEAYSFFEQGNKWVCGQLIQRFKSGAAR